MPLVWILNCSEPGDALQDCYRMIADQIAVREALQRIERKVDALKCS